MRARHVPGSVRIDCDNVELWKSTGDKQKIGAGIVNRRRDELFRRTIHYPMTSASIRIVTRHGFVTRKNHLRFSREIADQRHAITARVILTRDFPKDLPVSPAQSHNVRIAIVIPVDDHLVFE